MARGGKVLTIGLDPRQAKVMFAPELTPEIILKGVSESRARMERLGFEVVDCMIWGAAARETAQAALKSQPFDIVVIGAGLRINPEHLLLFEDIINLVHENAPKARIALHVGPHDIAAAVERVSTRWPPNA